LLPRHKMAEIFGAVASGIGIAGVAAQAIDGIRKLQTFCNDIRDAPEEIKYMTNELEILLGTIAGIEAQIQRNASICQNMNPTSALRFVEQSVRSLNAVIQELNAEIAQKRKLGSLKMAWKKKVLDAHLSKIERSKTSLGLAVSAYST
jgi:flagellar biosynthesis chaperone FliJ